MTPAQDERGEDLLILVDEQDTAIGQASKSACHQNDGILHRAFSVLLFDDAGRLLLQQRSAAKPLWPMYWSNSCCSHPRQGEELQRAAVRRVAEELGCDAELRHLYWFIYQAHFCDVGAEHELCHVLIGKAQPSQIDEDPAEIAAWKYVEPEKLDAELREHPEHYTPWFQMEWERVRREHWQDVQELLR